MCSIQSREKRIDKKQPASKAVAVNPQDEKLLRSMREKVREQLSRSDLKVELIASQLFMSERQFYREVKRITRCTPNQLIQAWRLEFARELLRDGGVQNLQHLARRVGYAKSDYFSKLYKKQYGESPSVYIDIY